MGSARREVEDVEEQCNLRAPKARQPNFLVGVRGKREIGRWCPNLWLGAHEVASIGVFEAHCAAPSRRGPATSPDARAPRGLAAWAC
jgi:hypothetical protein